MEGPPNLSLFTISITAFLASSALLVYAWARELRIELAGRENDDNKPPPGGSAPSPPPAAAPEPSANPAAAHYLDVRSRLAELKALAAQVGDLKAAIGQEVQLLSARARVEARGEPAVSQLRAVRTRLAQLKKLAAEQAGREELLLRRLAQLAQEAMKPPEPPPAPRREKAEKAEARAGVPTVFKPAASRKKAPSGLKTVLVCDDDETLLDLLEVIFKTAGYAVLAASNGHECLRTLEEHDPDLMIIDLNMPVINGFEVLEALSREGSELGRRPFFVLSAHERKQDVERVKSLGARDYIVKPFDVEELMRRVRELLPA